MSHITILYNVWETETFLSVTPHAWTTYISTSLRNFSQIVRRRRDHWVLPQFSIPGKRKCACEKVVRVPGVGYRYDQSAKFQSSLTVNCQCAFCACLSVVVPCSVPHQRNQDTSMICTRDMNNDAAGRVSRSQWNIIILKRNVCCPVPTVPAHRTQQCLARDGSWHEKPIILSLL